MIGPVAWGYRIHPPNECSGYDIQQSDGNTRVLGNVEYPFITIAPRSTL